jgi:hypothetical protein
LPGAVLLFVIIYVVWTLPATLGLPVLEVSLLKDQGLLLSIAFFVASYVLGYLLRLGTAYQVDKESSDYRLEEWRRRKKNQTREKHFKQLLNQMRQGKNVDIPRGFDNWVWRAEPFPYPVWYLRKAAFYPPEIPRFFDQYKRCMGLVPDSLSIAGHQFFNYCKLVISSKEDSVLREEINAAESSTRFLVGTYSALRLSLWIFVTLLAFQLTAMAVSHIRGISVADLSQSHLISLVVYTTLLILGSHAARNHIKKHFRRLRLKEADTVYDAFYLVCKEKDHDAKSPCDPETTRSTFSEDR